MAISVTAVIEAAARAYGREDPLPFDQVHHKLEWVWGLEYGTLDQHISNFDDRQVANILVDDDLILVPDLKDVKKMKFHCSNLPDTVSKSRVMINDIYDCQSFQYLVLPVDPSSGTAPQLLVSSIPPHLTICSSVDKIVHKWGWRRDDFHDACGSILDLVVAVPPSGATSSPDLHTFMDLRYLHETWATHYAPSRFLGLEVSDEVEEESDEGSSTMEWEVCTVDDEEPQRRLLPHELEAEPVYVTKFLAANRSGDDDDELISHDSHISGVDDPEEFAKASKALGDYKKDASWSEGIQSWTTDVLGVDDDQMMLNDAQIAEDPQEKPRVAASLDFDDPDYVSTAARQGRNIFI
ncbi:hypothetical protein DFH06DRAFT_1155570 [Mycena polygramma]|nr:hypothetical protein DFH06DRAFT_1155570 [Mycena polygramma]